MASGTTYFLRRLNTFLFDFSHLLQDKPGFENQINRLIKIFEDDFIFNCKDIACHKDDYSKEYFRIRDIPLGIATSLSKSISQLCPELEQLSLSTISSLFLQSWFQNGCNSDEIRIENIIPLKVSTEVKTQYIRMRASMPSVSPLFLWHGTSNLCCTTGVCSKSQCSLCSILREGFSPEKARTGTTSYRLFGCSSYFASESMVAHGYNGKNESLLGNKRRVVILSEVIFNNPLRCLSSNMTMKREFQFSDLPNYFQTCYHTQNCDCFITSAEDIPRSELEDIDRDVTEIINFPTHFMIQNGHQILPRYVVIYQYPERFSQILPYDVTEQRYNNSYQPEYCKFHGMWHKRPQDSDDSCDASLWYNYVLSFFNSD